MRVSVLLAQGWVCLRLHLGLVSSWLLGDAKELIQLLLTLEMESSSFSTGLCPVLLGTPLKSAVWGGFTEHRILERPGLEGILKFSTQLLFYGFFFCAWLTYLAVLSLGATFCSHLHFVSTGSLCSGVLAEARSNVS